MEGLPVHESDLFNFGPKVKSMDIEYQVPSGKIWVIEFVSATAYLAEGDRFGPLEIWTSAHNLEGGTSRPHHHFIPHPVGNTNRRYCVSQPTRIYAMPGSSVLVYFSRDLAKGEAHLMFTLSGRLVDA
ncbi:MAG TPA: hypothetical protein VJ984_14855 [Xanthomonadales bacterium]|nr:hypothetical protein [Xanthomonadales bacterium]